MRDRSIDRRDFMRTALAIGGTGALAAISGCTGAESGGSAGDLGVPQGSADPSAFPDRQHAWNADLKRDEFGNPVLPNHQLLLFLEYDGGGEPTDPERETVEAAFRTLERAFRRLAGGDPSADNEGLVFMVGYTPGYFDRFDDDLPGSVDLRPPEEVLRETGDDPDKADSFDALILLSSDEAPVVLAAEEALFGGIDSVNGVDVAATLDGIFRRVERRTAFTGKGMPHDRLDNEDIHEDAPLSMGYKSGFDDNQAPEDRVTIGSGPFEGGTTMQISKLRLDLGEWYENDRGTRDELMFSHEHSPEEVGEVGEGLEDDSGITEGTVEDLEEKARAHGRVGHAAKAARARDGEFEPLILRRSEGINNEFHDGGRVDFNFSAVMEGIGDFVRTRKAMNSTDLDPHVDEGGHGILPFMEVTNRATLLVPPRGLRALPEPNPPVVGGATPNIMNILQVTETGDLPVEKRTDAHVDSYPGAPPFVELTVGEQPEGVDDPYGIHLYNHGIPRDLGITVTRGGPSGELVLDAIGTLSSGEYFAIALWEPDAYAVDLTAIARETAQASFTVPGDAWEGGGSRHVVHIRPGGIEVSVAGGE